jgi:uncharacterized membrane protein
MSALRRLFDDPYRLVLLACSALYVWIFTGMAWRLHAGMRTHKADLGQIDQAIWNSSRGRFVEMTDNGYLATRMSDHVEPILALISPVYWVWDDTRAILLLQTLFVAVGAWLLYELTLTLFDNMLLPEQRAFIWHTEPMRAHSRPLGLALGVAYLLAPQLQSALLTEFHAAPLAVPLILWALLSIERGRWTQFMAAAVLTALVKEEMALLAAGLGVWAMWRGAFDRRQLSVFRSAGFWAGTAVAALSLLWFYVATFVIVPIHAAAVYGVAESGYFQRYGALGDSPLSIVMSFFTQPGVVWQIATEPVRLRYVFNLLVVFGFLSLPGGELLLLSLPVFLANLLSAYPAQYYGEFHYSAPLVPYVAAAAAFGVSRAWRGSAGRMQDSSASFQHLPAADAKTMAAASFFTNSRYAVRPLVTAGLALWIIAWAIFAYAQFGRGPGGGRYDPTPVTAHHELLSRFVSQIPQEAAITATAAVHPHVSHRRYVYQFPLGLDQTEGQLGNAEWALLDVTTNTDMAPGDLHARVQEMLAGEWGVVDGADGFLLLQKGISSKEIPDEFYDFARRPDDGNQVVDAPLRFAGAQADDWSRWRQTKLIAAWHVGSDFSPQRDAPRMEVRSPAGDLLHTLDEVTPPALVWYPPERWQASETIQITTLPLYLPLDWGIAVSHGEEPTTMLQGSDDLSLAARYSRNARGRLIDRTASSGLSPFTDDEAQQERVIRFADPVAPLTVRTQVSTARQLPGAPVDVRLWWQGDAGWPTGKELFVHLRGPESAQAQQDGLPRYLVPYDVNERLRRYDGAPDWRQPVVPDDALPGDRWEIVLGLYSPADGQRAEVIDDVGNVLGNEAKIGEIVVGPPLQPDQACALVPQSCVGQPR